MKHTLYMLMFSAALHGCTNISYWKSEPKRGFYSSSPEEIQLTDSTFTIYQYNGTGCLPEYSGSGEMRNSVIKGDTILIYDYRPVYPHGDTVNFEWKPVLYEAYYMKNRKLYFIYSHYPWIGAWFADSTSSDSSKIKMAKVNWEGWAGGEAYINFNDKNYFKGKNRYLRKLLYKNHKENKVTNWYLSLPRELVNDSIIHPHCEDKLGPLKH